LISRINSETKLYLLIGDPVEHSFSPFMHNAAFQFLGINSVYLTLQVKSDGLIDTIKGMRSMGIPGINVTIPHKISIMKYLDEIDSHAKIIGAVNTVVNKDGRLIGYNTDGIGAITALKTEKADPEGKKVVVLGAGGAARALSFSIAPSARKLVVLNRTKSKATSLVKAIKTRLSIDIVGEALTINSLSRELTDTDLLINTTSVGMFPKIEETLVDRQLIKPNMVVFDIIYNPPETRFLKEAKASGAKVLNGINMLVNQGALSFKLWIGLKPPMDVMYRAINRGLREG
jgi:shikimate dehydrogenase